MPETWVYIIGGILIAIIAFIVGYTLISSTVNISEKQSALSEFSKIFADIESVCYHELNNSMEKKYFLSFPVRVMYATDLRNRTLITVVDKINKEISSGKNFCLQFKDEAYQRCLPEPPEVMLCNLSMPYIGVLPESEDIWMMVNKILGKPRIREYSLIIKKTGESEVTISLGAI